LVPQLMEEIEILIGATEYMETRAPQSTSSQRIPGMKSVASCSVSAPQCATAQAFLARYNLKPPRRRLPTPINLAFQSAYRPDLIFYVFQFQASKVATLASLPSISRLSKPRRRAPWPQPPPLSALRSLSSLVPIYRRSRSAAHPLTTRPMRSHPHPWTKTRLRQDGR
jgi:hypothetical protein